MPWNAWEQRHNSRNVETSKLTFIEPFHSLFTSFSTEDVVFSQ